MTDRKSAHDPSSFEYPKIRMVETYPIEQNGQQSVCLRDPLHIAPNMLALPIPVFFIASLFDGNHSLRNIQEECKLQLKQLIPISKIEEIVRQLDAELYLESETFRLAVKKIEQAYHDAPFRAPSHAGTAYHEDAGALNQELSGYFEAIQEDTLEESLPENGHVSVLVAPHIDLRRGGPCFAYAYREIAKRPPADLYIVLGTGHQMRKGLISLTRKSYDSPLGPIETDTEFVERLSGKIPVDGFEEELLHRDEHSIEFQVLFLRYILGDQWKGKMVPILTGSLHTCIQDGMSPRSDRFWAETLDALRESIEAYPGMVTVIAGADMSHVGQRFGHPRGIPPTELERVEREDQDTLNAMISGNAETFFRSVEAVKDKNNICGLAPIYMALDVMRPSPGYVLQYDRVIEKETESVVSFASVSFYKE